MWSTSFTSFLAAILIGLFLPTPSQASMTLEEFKKLSVGERIRIQNKFCGDDGVCSETELANVKVVKQEGEQHDEVPPEPIEVDLTPSVPAAPAVPGPASAPPEPQSVGDPPPPPAAASGSSDGRLYALKPFPRTKAYPKLTDGQIGEKDVRLLGPCPAMDGGYTGDWSVSDDPGINALPFGFMCPEGFLPGVSGSADECTNKKKRLYGVDCQNELERRRAIELMTEKSSGGYCKVADTSTIGGNAVQVTCIPEAAFERIRAAPPVAAAPPPTPDEMRRIAREEASRPCWDVNKDGENQPSEDVNKDGQWDEQDCVQLRSGGGWPSYITLEGGLYLRPESDGVAHGLGGQVTVRLYPAGWLNLGITAAAGRTPVGAGGVIFLQANSDLGWFDFGGGVLMWDEVPVDLSSTLRYYAGLGIAAGAELWDMTDWATLHLELVGAYGDQVNRLTRADETTKEIRFFATVGVVFGTAD